MSEIIGGTWTTQELTRALEEVAQRAKADEQFKKLALSDGMTAMARVNPKPLPAGTVINFVENSGPLKTIPLPPLMTSSDSGEITEEELEAVAGGNSVAVQVYCTCGSVTYTHDV